jgi:hypothetical protein
MVRIIFLLTLILSFGFCNDIRIVGISEPAGFIKPADYIPRVQVQNPGERGESLWLFFRILTTSGNTVYYDSSFENINCNELKRVEFNTWTAIIGSYITKCSLYVESDSNINNNTYSSKVRVEVLEPGEWLLRDYVPDGLSEKKVKDGAGLADFSKDGDYYIYVLKGNKTDEFYLYDIILGTWQQKKSVPYSVENPNKPPRKGTCLLRINDYIYLAKGNKTFEFWKYSITEDTWFQMQDIPRGPSGKYLKGGSALTKGKIGDKKFLLLIKGSGTNEFYAYDTDLNTWIEKVPVPNGRKKTKIKKGSCLADNGEDIYLLKDKTNELFFYDCDSDTWERLKTLPFYGSSTKKKKIKDGSAVAYFKGSHDLIYALKGRYNEFWCYSVELDSWVEINPMPLQPSNKKVKAGGALLSMAGRIFALKGNKTNELWIYSPADTLFKEGGRQQPANTQQDDLIDLPYNKLPDISTNNLVIFDAVGRKIRISPQVGGYLRNLKPGIYFAASLNSKDYYFKKFIVIR